MLSLIALVTKVLRVRLAGQHVRFAGLQQHVVEGEAEADVIRPVIIAIEKRLQLRQIGK
jgi:hypothetical protein